MSSDYSSNKSVKESSRNISSVIKFAKTNSGQLFQDPFHQTYCICFKICIFQQEQIGVRFSATDWLGILEKIKRQIDILALVRKDLHFYIPSMLLGLKEQDSVRISRTMASFRFDFMTSNFLENVLGQKEKKNIFLQDGD